MSDAEDDSRGIRTVHRETVRTGRYHVAGADPVSARHICFILHGYGQLAARILRHFEGIMPSEMSVVAPEALNRFYTAPLSKDGSHMQRVGATWLTRDDREHEIADAIRWLDLVHDDVMRNRESPASTSVIGFSQGVATGIRWAMLGKVRPTHFVIWAGSLATDMNQQHFGTVMEPVKTTLVAGTEDEFISTQRLSDLQMQLDQAGVQYDLRRFDGGHTLDRDVLRGLLQEIAGAASS